jgi:hypothetical protein
MGVGRSFAVAAVAAAQSHPGPVQRMCCNLVLICGRISSALPFVDIAVDTLCGHSRPSSYLVGCGVLVYMPPRCLRGYACCIERRFTEGASWTWADLSYSHVDDTMLIRPQPIRRYYAGVLQE